jgi:hypothetical protein
MNQVVDGMKIGLRSVGRINNRRNHGIYNYDNI